MRTEQRDRRLKEAVEIGHRAGVAAGRKQVADEIRAALAADEADSDVSSGEAIWEQAGYRNGLAAAAEIATEVKP